MGKNKLYTLSYFIKRLSDCKIFSTVMISKNINKSSTLYHVSDIRQWTLNISPGNHNIICTCFKDGGEFWFKLRSQYNDNIKVKTLSMESIIKVIKDLSNGPNNVILTNDNKVTEGAES